MSFKHLKNFRDFEGYRKNDGTTMKGNVFARSENPACLETEEVSALKGRGFLWDIDLRRDNERTARPDCFGLDDAVNYQPVILNDAPYATFGEVLEPQGIAAAYYHSLTASAERISAVFRIMAKAKDGVLFHCESGKDRTGTIAGLLLLLCGVREEDIIEDYRLSYDRLYIDGDPELLSDPTLVPMAANMTAFLELFYRDFRSAEDYFLHIGLTPEELNAIKAKS